jgi:hypothetical protein
MELHHSRRTIAAEHTSKALLKGHDGTVEYAICVGHGIAGDDGISLRTPDNVTAVLGPVFPGNVGQLGSHFSCVCHSSCLLCGSSLFIDFI